MASEFGEKFFSLVEVIIADYNGAAYDTPISLDVDQMVNVEFEADVDELRDSGAITDGLTIVTRATLTIGWGGIDHSALAIMTGTSTSTSGSSPNVVRTHDFKGGAANALPYFGIIGVAYELNAGRVAIGLPRCKLNRYPNWALDGKENKFVISEVPGKAFAESDNFNGMVARMRSYESSAEYVTPVDAAAMLEFFNANPAP